ncbi:MAG: ATP-binding protein [Paludibacter sp.]|nr:ATP-binding protein [Paludibacter sp.]
MNEKQLSMFDFDEEYSLYSLIQNDFLPDEYNEIEYKSGKYGFPKELWKTYSAFANTNTGIIVIGVNDRRGVYTVEGLTEEQLVKYKKQFWDDCNNPNTVSINLLKNEDIKVVEIQQKKLLAIRVPFARRTERPVYLTRNPFGNTYKRNHEGDYRCTDDEVKRMLADSSTELKRDSLMLENYDMDDLDAVSIRQFRQLFSSTRTGHPWLALEDKELLKKLGAYRIDRKTKQEGITLAGLLMFGKAGSGVDKIMTGWQESHWRRPFLELESQPDRVKLTLPMFSVIPEQVLSELSSFFEDVSHLSPDELTALSFCQIEGSISNHRLQYVLNLHSSDITGMLKKLCAEDYLESDNNGRWTIYKLKQNTDLSGGKVASSGKVATFGNVDDNQLDEGKRLASSGEKVASSEKKVASSGDMPEFYGKNKKWEELERIVLELCKDDYIKKEELAVQLGKSENYVRNKILPRLLKNGKICKRFPYTHNHPGQGYKTNENYAEEL